jgi:hypothetical protein
MESGGKWLGWSVSGVKGREREVLDMQPTVLVLQCTARAHSLCGICVYHSREQPRCNGDFGCAAASSFLPKVQRGNRRRDDRPSTTLHHQADPHLGASMSTEARAGYLRQARLAATTEPTRRAHMASALQHEAQRRSSDRQLWARMTSRSEFSLGAALQAKESSFAASLALSWRLPSLGLT